MTLIGYDNQGRPIYPTVVTPAELAASRQAADARIQAAVDARVKREAAAGAERERRQAEQGAAALEAFRSEARAAFPASGGTAGEFVDAWPRLKRDHLTERAAERLTLEQRTIEATKEQLKATGRYSW